MIGSHNSFSFLPIKGWKKILRPWIRCQEYNIQGQIEYNVKYFDIRVRKYKNEWWLCHNTALFCPLKDRIEDLRRINNNDGYVRIILDVRKKPKYNAELLKRDFLDNLIPILNTKYYLCIDSIIVFWEWKELNTNRKIIQYEYHNSVISPWYKYILGNKRFASKYNEEKINEAINNKTSVMLLDYVNIK